MNSIIDKLNEEQRQALLAVDGPVLVTAGAGSGKTRLLTHRISYLISELKVAPYNILAITFTNKAAREMKNRVEDMTSGGSGVWISTIHSMCATILRGDIDKLSPNYNSRFTIYSPDDCSKVIKQILTDKGYDKSADGLTKSISYHISNMKNANTPLHEYKREYSCVPDIDVIIDTIDKYNETLEKCNALDFDDLLVLTDNLLKTCPEVLEFYSKRFKYILVDEFQDTNLVQYSIVKRLASFHGNLFVVGDEDQCIYGWRGANIANIKNLLKDYPNCKLFKLERNYRSTPNILNLANKLIEFNTERIPKTLYTQKPDGNSVVYRCLQSDRDEAEFVIQKIYALHQMGYKYSDMAILMRLNALSRNFEQRLLSYNIPHTIYGGFKFFDRVEVKNVIAYLRLVNNPSDNASFMRIVNFPKRGIGDTSIDKLSIFASQNELSLLKAIDKIDLCDALNSSAKQKLKDFAALMKNIAEYASEQTTSETIEYIAKVSGILDLYSERNDENMNRKMNISSLVDSAIEFEETNNDYSLSSYLQSITLLSDIDGMQDSSDVVTIATVHAVKGLEFKIVFVVGLEQKVFPITREDSDEQEERRLMYVAITRAEEQLFITNAKERFLYDKVEQMIPSKFLKELEFISKLTYDARVEAPRPRTYGVSGAYNEYGDDTDDRPQYVKHGGGKSLSELNTNLYRPQNNTINTQTSFKKGFDVGVKVNHSHYGAGVIVATDGVGLNKMVRVQFDSVGLKQLLLEYAPLTLI